MSTLRYDGEFKFFSDDFWYLFNKYEGKCALTGRALTPENTEVEIRNRHLTKEEGREEVDNHYLVDRDVKHLARYLSEDQIIELAVEIIKYRGKEKGFALRKLKGKQHGSK